MLLIGGGRLRVHKHDHTAALQLGGLFHIAYIGTGLCKALHDTVPQLGMRHLTAAEADGHLDAVAGRKELLGLVHLGIKIVGINVQGKPGLLHLYGLLVLPGFLFALGLLETELAVVDDLAHRRHSLRRNYGMVLQETWLKEGTIRDNIVMGKPDATEKEIIDAAKAAHSHGFITRLPKGYDTVIGEDGGSLSQGQKQLLCITRVMFCLPPMLILDEATSSIDTRTEQHIQHAFAQLMQGRTSFIVAHRLSTIKNADMILVMKDGDIIEKGKHDELVARGGFYAALYNSQFTR